MDEVQDEKHKAETKGSAALAPPPLFRFASRFSTNFSKKATYSLFIAGWAWTRWTVATWH